MRRFFAGLAVAAVVVVPGVPALAKTETVKGQIVDRECYLREKKADTDTSCAVECAKSGKPMALLTSHGKQIARRNGGERE